MDSNNNGIRTITARLNTDKPVRKTPYQVKGVIMDTFPDEEIVPMLNGQYRDRFLYPRVQVKILNEQIYLVGVKEGVDPILSVVEKMEALDFGNITFEVSDSEKELHDDHFQPIERLIRYRFITPWVALNQTTGGRYRFLPNAAERVHYLNRLLGQNIVFLAREMDIKLEENLFTKVALNSLFPKPVDESGWGAFTGEFRTNFLLPNYMGIGNGITRGYGALFGLFNPDMFQYSKEEMEKTGEPLPEENDMVTESEVEIVNLDEVPKPRPRSSPKKPKPKKPAKPAKPKKVLSEEFDIVEDEYLSGKVQKPKRRKPSSRRPAPRRKETKVSGDDKFNSDEYHKKQHNL